MCVYVCGVLCCQLESKEKVWCVLASLSGGWEERGRGFICPMGKAGTPNFIMVFVWAYCVLFFKPGRPFDV